MYAVTNPATGEVVQEFPTATDEQVAEAIERTHTAFAQWRARPAEERAAIVNKVADLYIQRKEELAELIATEMGKSIPEAIGEIELSARIYQYYADNAALFLQDQPLAGPTHAEAFVQKRPVGSILGIMPWNYPYYQVARFAAPNLALGNTIILKHAPNCPMSAAQMEAIFQEAGVPADVYVNVYATNEQVADIIADPRNQGVSLTGSERAGAAVAETAGRNLKKVVLELGGSDPYIFLDTDDLDATVKLAAQTRLGNTGQACNSPKRMIVLEDLYDDFVEKITAEIESSAESISALSSQAAADRFVEQVKETVAQGATLRAGGDHRNGAGAFVEPVVLTDVKPGMRAYHEELFGPAVMVFKAANEEEAVALANDTPYGLGSAVFSTDVARARAVGEQIEAGMVYINAPEGTREFLPFGGVKRSGIGRELGPFAMDEFANKRLVYIAE